MKDKSNLAALFLVVALVAGFLFFASDALAVQPNGVSSISEQRSETAPADTASNDSAIAGNITEMVITAYSTTQSWQGYVGNISGAIRLADTSGDVLYNWSLANPSGEIYASTNSTITWTGIVCFNYTAAGNYSTGGEAAGGGTSLYGTNLSQLETQFGLSASDIDGVDATFTDANSHVEFFTAGKQFSAGECVSTDVFDSNGIGTDGNYEEVILYEPATASVVFASLIESGSVDGFDSKDYDFEMLVLENGHGTDTDTTTYYFFVELE
ncbi:MAG: hypothetical protein ABH864_00775 [archaeon]